MRLGGRLLAKGDAKKALDQFDADRQQPQERRWSPRRPTGPASASCALGKPDEAVKRLAVFRDQGLFQNCRA